MKESDFVRRRQAEWEAWDRWLGLEAKRSARRAPVAGSELPTLSVETLPASFRRLCQDLSLARDRNYSSPLVHALHDRVLAAHQRVYGAPRRVAGHALSFLAGGLPRAVRAEARLVLAAALLFFLPLLAGIFLLQIFPEGIFMVLPGEEVGKIEAMYAPDAPHPGRRPADDDLMMLAFYIANNVRIDFQCFAGGIAFGLGSVFFLVFNGIHIGAIAGHLTQIGYGETFWAFVAGHSAPELVGAVLSGAGGLRIGLALVAPGRLSRVEALKAAGRRAVLLLYGAALLTFAAAFVESLWSPLRYFSFDFKVGVGIAVWVALIGWLALAGRGPRAA
jgi:uncharacterized membrane protein SpoIIM required for sporulation